MLSMTLLAGVPLAYVASRGTPNLQDQASKVGLKLLPEAQCLRTDAVVAAAAAAAAAAAGSPAVADRQLNLSSDGGRRTCGQEIPTCSSTMPRAGDDHLVAARAV